MTTIATLLNNDADLTGCGVDLLDGVYDTGRTTVFDCDFAMLGGNGIAGSVAMGGRDDAMVGIVAQTGAAGADAAILIGAEGTDCLAAAAFPAIGLNLGLDHSTPAGLGFNGLRSRDAMPTTAVSRDLSVSLILHRIDTFFAFAPARISLRTGGAL